MATATAEPKHDTPELPKGCTFGTAPDGTSRIIVRVPRGSGPWFRVKHLAYGHRLVQAANEDEALQKYFHEFNPGLAQDLNWCKESMRLNGGRIGRLPETATDPKPPTPPAPHPTPAPKPAPAPEPVPPTPPKPKGER